jgi:hypothetical protein
MTSTMSLKATLAALVSEHGMAAVLATARNLLAAEAEELCEMDNETDLATAEKVEAVGSMVLDAADAYSKL